ncbi:MAG: hypothetical protein IPK97_11485 [Ahniella sp.]|nr:hypothetical protein [Ahniella sp.]
MSINKVGIRAGCWLFLTLVWSSGVMAVTPYWADPVPQGQLDVSLVANAGVQANVPVIAAFGVPFPRGSINSAGLANLRVFDQEQEIPAYVEALTPWRHRTDVQIDNQSVRVALVQVEVVFPNPALPRLLTVRWGGPVRTLNRPSRATRASTWTLVEAGSFVAADAVHEPRVLALLPPEWLSLGVLKGNRALPFAAGNPASRDNPATNDAVLSWPAFEEQERAHKNDFYTVINEDDPAVLPANLCPYKTDFEPWLYDRAATMFALHFRSGSAKALREALRFTDFYRARINASGMFTLKADDNKYAFNESLAYAFWMTGDETFLPAISLTAGAHNGTQHVWSTGLGFWTERSAAFKLMAHTIDYEITGNQVRRDSVDEIVNALSTHQDGANGVIPAAGRIDGGFYHTGAQHGDWDAAAYGASTWMTALLTDALRRAYLTRGDTTTAHMIRRTGTFLKTSLRTAGSDFGTTVAPRYVIEFDGTDFAVQSPLHEVEHALNVGSAIAWADYFGALLAQRDATLVGHRTSLYATYDLGVNFWIRPAGPASGLAAFRVTPWRKWSWQHRTSDGLSFAVMAADAVAGETPMFINSFEG